MFWTIVGAILFVTVGIPLILLIVTVGIPLILLIVAMVLGGLFKAMID